MHYYNLREFFTRICPLAMIALLAMTSSAMATNYGDFTGPHIKYLDVTEFDSQILGPPGVITSPVLFGLPGLQPPLPSDTLAFPALQFSVQVADGQFEQQDGKLSMNIIPSVIGGALHNLTFDEGGSWKVIGPDSTSSPSTASIAESTLLFNDLRITSLNGVPLGINSIIVSPTFTQVATTQAGSAHTVLSNGDVTVTSAGGNGVGLWDIVASFNLDAALAAANKTGQLVTGVSVSLDNQLFGQTRQTEDLTLATIDKKHFIIDGIVTDPVPEPSTIALVLLGSIGLTGFGLRGRRRDSMCDST